MSASRPDIRYTRAGDVHIAYTTLGEGPDLVFAPGAASGIEWFWEDRWAKRFLDQLATFSRLIIFDKRGTGHSDPIVGAPTLEERAADITAAMDAVGSEHAVIFGFSEGGAMGALLAAAQPQRVRGLIPWGTPVRAMPDAARPEVPFVLLFENREQVLEAFAAAWGTGYGSELINPDSGNDPEVRASLARWQLLGGTPTTFLTMLRLTLELDITALLPSIHVPTLVLHRRGEMFVPVEHARYLASLVPDARLVELDGGDHFPWLGDWRTVVDLVREFVTGTRAPVQPNRILATVLFTDFVSSTERLASIGDESWTDLLHQHDAIAREEIGRHSGRLVKSTGDGVLATFDGPTRGVRCAQVLRERSAALGLRTRAGLHTGEIEMLGNDIGGLGVVIASRVSSLAGEGEVLVSRTVKDLAAGSGITFEDRGVHGLKGVPEEWQLFSAL